MPPVILADSAFPLKNWLLKPYTNAILSPKQRYFNYRLSRARIVIEGAYGQLKGRFRVLLQKCESSCEQVKVMTLECFVLHNICIDRGDTIPSTLDITVDPKTKRKLASGEVQDLLHMTAERKLQDKASDATKIRDKLAEQFWEEKNNALLAQATTINSYRKIYKATIIPLQCYLNQFESRFTAIHK